MLKGMAARQLIMAALRGQPMTAVQISAATNRSSVYVRTILRYMVDDGSVVENWTEYGKGSPVIFSRADEPRPPLTFSERPSPPCYDDRQEPDIPIAVDRTPCPCCGARADIGCSCKLPQRHYVTIGEAAHRVLQAVEARHNG